MTPARWTWVLLAAVACGGGSTDPAKPATAPAATQGGAQQQGTPSCPARLEAPEAMPHTPEKVTRLEYWLDLYGKQADRTLLSVPQMRAHNAAVRFAEDGQPRVVDMLSEPPAELLTKTLQERLSFLLERLQSGKYAAEDADEAKESLSTDAESFEPGGGLYVALGLVPLRCGPYLGRLTSTEGDPRFDRNNCSSARPGEPVEVLGRIAGVRFVRTAFSVGFIADDAPLSPALDDEQRARWLTGPRARLEKKLTVGQGEKVVTYEAGTVLPSAGEGRVHVAGADGFTEQRVQATQLDAPLTRRALLTEAFRYLNTPYGWGGEGGGRDCSRLLMDVFRGVGLQLPRNSVPQSQAGTYSVEVPDEASDTDRLALLDAANERGVVLIHFPGHIMLYLGRDRDETPRALHAFAEYLVPCDDGGETLYEVDTVTVSDLSLGKGSSRRSFLERITRLTVFGEPPGFALQAFAEFRRSAPPPPVPKKCEDSLDVAMFRSPRVPTVDQPMRAIVTSQLDHRPARLVLIDPKGEVHEPELTHLGVGPFTQLATIDSPRQGRWTMLLADGPRVVACERFGVLLEQPPPESSRTEEDPAWQSRFSWERDTEALYAAFIEQLFSHPVDDARTWPSLSALLRDPERNILINHLGMNEDKRMVLEPDCADLPYFLRAYFAWKIDLPFGFRRCSRGRAGQPPRCNELITNRLAVPGSDEVEAFKQFALRNVRPGVHSASNRTLPRNPDTDMYPLPLTREALKPGAVFNDPYGHIIVVAKWVPQGLDGEGMLLGADAQPDATVGRRRFWRGSFLFTPSTEDVGAGFKAFRPIVRPEPGAEPVALDSQGIDKSPHHPDLSMQQYEGTAADFYARMDALIYPRPLAPAQRITRLVEALEEQVLRRVTSVDTGEEWITSHRGGMNMPDGYAIFETTGPWEDFATPSRDMRLLIAIDTVLGLPELVAQAPERFGFEKGAAQEARRTVQTMLRDALEKRSFSYTGSDGEPVTLTLADVVDRAEALEMAYNPNDCLEIRWGAPEGGPEMERCDRHAPAGQRKKMERYRSWFATRTRPARP